MNDTQKEERESMRRQRAHELRMIYLPSAKMLIRPADISMIQFNEGHPEYQSCTVYVDGQEVRLQGMEIDNLLVELAGS